MPHNRYQLRLGIKSTEIFIAKNEAPSLSDYAIQLSGITHINDDYFLSRHTTQYHVVLYTVSGEGLLNIQNNNKFSNFQLKAGDLLSLPKNHTYDYQVFDQDWHFLWFILEPTAHWDFIKSAVVKNIENAHRLKPILRLLSDKSHDELKPVLVKEMYRILSQGLSENSRPNTSQQNFKLRLLFEEVAEQLHYPWSAVELAKRMHCAVPSLHRYCQKEYSLSPMQYVIQLRISRAKVLLKETHWTLDVIASQLGYASGLSLSKVFKQKEGVSPIIYRNESDGFGRSRT